MGTLVPPLPIVSATKFAALYIDADGDGDFSPGDTIRYSVRISNNSPIAVPIGAVNVQDTLPAAASYVPDSTTYQADDQATPIAVPDDATGTAFPLDGAGVDNLDVLEGNTAATFQFDVLIDVTRGDCDADFVNTGEVRFPVDSDDPIDLLDRRRLTCSPAIDIEKLTNGQDADQPTGPLLAPGADVTWTYVVTNIGNTDLDSIQVIDDRVGSISCPQTSLAPAAQTVCFATGTAQTGQYENAAVVTATGAGKTVTDIDPSHYYGGAPAIDIEKSTNGQDADTAPGPYISVGDIVSWSYRVENTGGVALTDVTVTDDRLDDSAIDCDGDNIIASLSPGQVATCTATGVAVGGAYVNTGTVTATPPAGLTPPTDTDPSHHFGANPGLSLQKLTNGVDADDPIGPVVPIGSTVTFTYQVQNTGNETLTDVTVTDDQLADGEIDCGGDGDNVIPSLAPGATASCSATITATEGQYSNIGTVTGTPPGGPVPTTRDPSHHVGAQPSLTLQKLTNGEDADSAPGVTVAVGDPVTFTYQVTNDGRVDLTNVIVTDDRLAAGAIDCGGDGDNVIASLAAGASASCTATITATEGQYTNVGTVTGTPPAGFTPPTTTDPSNHTGLRPGIQIEKSTNGEDADTGTGPVVAVGSTVNFSYVVTNTGNVGLSPVFVTDDRLDDSAIVCSGTGVNAILFLTPGESQTCTASIVAEAGQYANVGTATGTPVAPGLPEPTDTDPSHHFGASPAISIQKLTNGEDADAAPGPVIPVGDPVTWTYRVENTGSTVLTNVTVTDNRIGDDSIIDCGEGTDNVIADLDPDEVVECSATGTAQDGQYTNIGSVTGTPPPGAGEPPRATDPSNYFGAHPGIEIEKATNGEDADVAPGPMVAVGDPVTWTYVVTNTGNETLTAVTVSDDQLVDDSVIDCGEGTANLIADLAPAEAVTCTATGTATAGQYTNIATVVGTPPPGGGQPPRDTDPSNHFGAQPAIRIEKLTNGEDADTAPGPARRRWATVNLQLHHRPTPATST
jgi:uncharacterized repeat protein (TIGR01451 family)